MKSCPKCQQLYSDALEVCPTDGSTLLNSSLGYTPGSSSGGYKWQSGQLPPTQGYWQQQQPPPPGWGYYPPPGSYPPPGAYPPPYGYGMPYTPPPQGGGLGTAALWTGISTMGCLVFGFLLILAGASSYATYAYDSTYRYGPPSPPASLVFGGILFFLSFVVGLTALILGIVATSMSGRNPNINRAKSVTGLCLGAAPYVLWFILLIAGTSIFPRRW
ncbi:MAG TPA: DUF4190 domain-containing protein [Pyrinomonadaceae bacterium]